MKLSPITVAEFQALKPYFAKQLYELCPYSLAAIIAWTNDGTYTPYYAVSGGHLIVAGCYKGERRMLLPVSPIEGYPPPALRELAVEAGVPVVWFVTEQYIRHFGKEAVASLFDIKEQPGYDDYIYRAEDLAELKGNMYSKKRNLINQFERGYVREGRVSVSPIARPDTAACIEFLDNWNASNNGDVVDEEGLAWEKLAARNALTHFEELEVNGLVLRIDGEVCAFGIGARLTADMGVLHFEKALSHIKGLYQYFDRECAGRLFTGLTDINKESDMGSPGLRKAKRSYYPARIMKSYQLTVR